MRPRRRTITWLGGVILLLAGLPAVCGAMAATAAHGPAPHASAQTAACFDSVKPVEGTHMLPPYPALSQKLGEKGTTRLAVTLDANGVPAAISIRQSSGSKRLDDAAMAGVKRVWRWQKLSASCAGVQTVVDVVWDLQNAPAATGPQAVIFNVEEKDYPPQALSGHEEGETTLTIALSKDGVRLQTIVTQSSGFPDLDAKAIEIASHSSLKPAEIDGHAVDSVMGIAVVFQISQPPMAPDSAGSP